MQSLTQHEHRRHAETCKKAQTLQKQNKQQDALVLLRKNLNLTTRALGLYYLLTLDDQESLSDCLSEAGLYAKAVTLDRKTLRARQKLNEKAPNTPATQYSLAYYLGQLNQNSEAISLYRKNLTAREEVLGINDDDTLETRQSLASCLYRSRLFGEARDLNEQVLQARTKKRPPDDYDLIACRHNLATNLRALGAIGGALTLTYQNKTVLQSSRSRDNVQLQLVLDLLRVIQQDIKKIGVRKSAKAKKFTETEVQAGRRRERNEGIGTHRAFEARNEKGPTEVEAERAQSEGRGEAEKAGQERYRRMNEEIQQLDLGKQYRQDISKGHQVVEVAREGVEAVQWKKRPERSKPENTPERTRPPAGSPDTCNSKATSKSLQSCC